MYTCVNTYVEYIKYMYTDIYTYVRTYTHTYLITYIRTYIHTYIHSEWSNLTPQQTFPLSI